MLFLSGCALLEREELLHLIAQFDIFVFKEMSTQQIKKSSQWALGKTLNLVKMLKDKVPQVNIDVSPLENWSNEQKDWETTFNDVEKKYRSATRQELCDILLKKSAQQLGVKILTQHWQANDLAEQIVLRLAELYEIETRGVHIEKVEEKLYEEILNNWLKNIQEKLDNCSNDTLDELSLYIEKRLSKLDLKERTQLFKELGLETSHAKDLVQFFKKNALALTLTSGLGKCGMGFYLAMNTILHAISTTMLGITLPFSVYAGMSSLGAAMLSFPAFLMFSAGVGGWVWNKQSKEINSFLVSSVLLSCRSRCL